MSEIFEQRLRPAGALLLLLLVLAACGGSPAATSTPAPTPPPSTPTPVVSTCADIDSRWGQDWPGVLEVLQELSARNESCGEEPLLSKQYAAHYNYGASLEQGQELNKAIEQYQAALYLDPQRQEALKALQRLEALPKPTPPACLSTSPPRPDPAPAGQPDRGQFATVRAGQLWLDGRPFTVKGVNYYPRRAPWQHFLTASDPAEMAQELDTIQQAGFNTLRIFLWYEPLFTCQPEDAIPNESAFAVVDELVELAAERDLKLIVALNDLPDLVFRPLYTDWDHYDAQTVYIVRRYRNQPAILAWDLRNEVDIDYGAQPGHEAEFDRAEVLDWVDHISQVVRQNDPYHMLTAGWWGDPTEAAAYVDFLSFHHWTDAADLTGRIKRYRQASDKPLMLQEVGYHSWASSPEEPRSEQEQARRLASVIGAAERENLAGWIIWTAFDFVPEPGQPAHNEHFFGLWRVDLSPKPALERLPLQP